MDTPVITQWIDIDSASGRFGGYLALPPAGRGPGLVLFQEIFGINRHIRAVVEQYALDGFVVLAPDLFWRQQHRIELRYEGADLERAMGLLQTVQHEAVLADIRATVAALKARPECTGKLGALGYCLGGRLAFVTASLVGVDAAIAYYGGRIQNQLELAPAIHCPMQFHYGDRDANIPLTAVDAVRAAMAGKDAEFHVYPEAGHGFNCWDRAAYNPPAAALAHGRTLSFLSRLFA